MSFAEVLTAARALTADERAELLHELAEPMPPVGDGIPKYLRQFIPPPGAVVEMNWPIEASAENIATLQLLFTDGAFNTELMLQSQREGKL